MAPKTLQILSLVFTVGGAICSIGGSFIRKEEMKNEVMEQVGKQFKDLIK